MSLGSQDRTDIPPLPDPWGSREASSGDDPGPPTTTGNSGCTRPAVIGCGCVALFVAVALVLLIAASGRIATWFVDTARDTIVSNLPADLTADERRRLETSFSMFEERLRSRSLSARGLTQLNVELQNAFARASSGSLERVDVERLQAAFDAVLGEAPAEPLRPRDGLPVAVASAHV